MSWLQRLGIRRWAAPKTEKERPPPWTERTSAGITEFFRGVPLEPSHSVLDLGSASETSFQVFEGLARWIRFGELVGGPGTAGEWEEVLSRLPAPGERPYDLVLGWDVLDRIRPDERPRFMAHLDRITAPEARLHLLVDASEGATSRPLRFTLVARDRVRLEPVGPPRANWPPILPAEMEHLLRPFRVSRAFTSKVGFREYVAVKEGG